MAGTDITLPQAGDEVSASWGQSVARGLNGIQSGVATLTWTGTAASDVPTVTFPKPYVAAPVVVCVLGANASAANISVGVRTVTATNFQPQGREVREAATTGAIQCQWVAVGVLA